MGVEPILNIIYDSRRIERREPLMEEMATQKIVYKIWDCIMLNDVVASINASHKMIVQYAKDNGLKETVISEEDLWFPSKNGWKYFLENKPEVYDLYLAATYVVPISNNIVCGFHLYMIHEKFYDKFLSVPDLAHIDTAMNDIKGDYKFCYPFAALQRPGFSANNKMVVNYNCVLKPEDIYSDEVLNIS